MVWCVRTFFPFLFPVSESLSSRSPIFLFLFFLHVSKWLLYPNKTLHKVWNFSSISIIQLPFLYFYGDQFVKNFHTRKWKRNIERGKVTSTISLSPPSSLHPWLIYVCCVIFNLLITCELTYKNHHTPILTYYSNKLRVENQIVTSRFKFKKTKKKKKQKKTKKKNI